MGNNKISIVVPIYKVPEQYLRMCINSLITQSYENIEILLVDDGSPDSCGKICDEYGKRDSRVQVIHKNNGGLSAARNSGYQAATGEWIMFVDGDDWIEPATCQTMADIAMKDHVQLVMCGMTKEYGHSSEPYKYYLENGKIYVGEECKWLQEQLLHFNGNIAVAYCKLISRQLLIDNGIEHDEELKQGAEGLEFNLRLFEKLESAVFINKPFYHYTYNENSISATHNEANHEFVIKCFEKIQNFINISDNRQTLLPWFYNRLLYVIITTAIIGYFSPSNPEQYSEKKLKYLTYINRSLVNEAIKSENEFGLSKQRKIVLFFIKHRLFFPLDIMGKMRKIQKNLK